MDTIRSYARDLEAGEYLAGQHVKREEGMQEMKRKALARVWAVVGLAIWLAGQCVGSAYAAGCIDQEYADTRQRECVLHSGQTYLRDFWGKWGGCFGGIVWRSRKLYPVPGKPVCQKLKSGGRKLPSNVRESGKWEDRSMR